MEWLFHLQRIIVPLLYYDDDFDDGGRPPACFPDHQMDIKQKTFSGAWHGAVAVAVYGYPTWPGRKNCVSTFN